MANRIPLIVDAANLNIKELPSGDALDLANSATLNVSSFSVRSNNLGNLNANTDLDIATDNYFVANANADITFAFTNLNNGYVAQSFLLEMTNGGSHTITWPAEVLWPSNTAPTLSSTGNTDLIIFITSDSGSNWYGSSKVAYYT